MVGSCRCAGAAQPEKPLTSMMPLYWKLYVIFAKHPIHQPWPVFIAESTAIGKRALNLVKLMWEEEKGSGSSGSKHQRARKEQWGRGALGSKWGQKPLLTFPCDSRQRPKSRHLEESLSRNKLRAGNYSERGKITKIW